MEMFVGWMVGFSAALFVVLGAVGFIIVMLYSIHTLVNSNLQAANKRLDVALRQIAVLQDSVAALGGKQPSAPRPTDPQK